MLSIPKHGWVNLSIGDWEDRASYLTDVPNDLLDALIEKLNNWKPVCVSFDAEGWEYILVIDSFTVHVIESEDEHKLYSFDISAKELAEEVYKDISENLNAWSWWDYATDTEEQRLKEEENLKKKLKALRKALDKK